MERLTEYSCGVAVIKNKNLGRIQSVYADMSSQETLGMDTMTFQSKEKRNTVLIAVRNCSGMNK